MHATGNHRSCAALVIREAQTAEAAIHRLLELDGHAEAHGPWLLAELAGRPAAAVSLADATVAADPFEPTLELVSLLRVRADQLRGRPGGRLRRGLRRLHVQPGAAGPPTRTHRPGGSALRSG